MQTQYFVWIYRTADGGDSSNGGVSSKITKAILYRDAKGAPAGALVLDEKPIHSGFREMKRTRAVPAGETRWVMFGGNFVWSTDSRFRSEVSEYPIPIHDRIEGGTL